jgi:hypothetical protein
MKKVLMALVVAGLIAGPLFAADDVNTVPGGFTTLVYSVSGSLKGWEFTSAAATSASQNKMTVKAYAVVEVNDATLVTPTQVSDVNDPNKLNNTTIILLGSTSSFKKAFAILRNGGSGGEGDDANVVTLDLATATQPIFTDSAKSKQQMVDAFFEASSPALFDFFTATSMFAKLTNVTLDKNVKINLPKSFSAPGELETFNVPSGFPEDDLTGSIKLQLNTSYTKTVDTFSVLRAADFVRNDLIGKGYTQVSVSDLLSSVD